MKTGRLFLGLALALAWHVPARAEDSPGDPGLPPLQLRFPERVTGPEPPLRVYGGGALKFTFAVEAPLGTHLRVVGDLFQLAAGGVAAPLRRDVPITPALAFEDRTDMQADGCLPDLPAVQRKTTMLLRLRAADATGGTVSRDVRLVVYPAAEPTAWAKTVAARLARGGLRRLAVCGEGTALRRFLRSRKVAFDDLGEDWPGEMDTHTLYLGEARKLPPPPFGEQPGARIVLFLPRADDDPLPGGVYQSSDARGGTLLKVTLPALFTAPGDDPAALEAFDEIFRRALEPRAIPETLPDPAATP